MTACSNPMEEGGEFLMKKPDPLRVILRLERVADDSCEMSLGHCAVSDRVRGLFSAEMKAKIPFDFRIQSPALAAAFHRPI